MSEAREGAEAGLFDSIFRRGEVREATSDAAWLAALLAVERALAAAEAEAGVIPPEDARAIDRACRTISLDPGALGVEAMRTGTPVVPLLAAIRERLEPAAGDSLHFGATSQDVMDSAGMLVAARALDALLPDVEASADAAAALGRAHRATPMAARTLLQQAQPTTFGALAASWLSALDGSAQLLVDVRSDRIAAQLGGPIGTASGLGEHREAIIAGLASGLGLAVPEHPWHTDRARVLELAAALGTVSAALGKVAMDLVLLSQDEVGEVRDAAPDRGASSSMPHKRNPVAPIAARACSLQVPGLVATLFSVAGQHELQRAAGAWHAEWIPLRDLLRTVGSAAAWIRDALEHLEVDADRMREHMEATIARSLGAGAAADSGAAERLVDDALARHDARRRGGAGT